MLTSEEMEPGQEADSSHQLYLEDKYLLTHTQTRQFGLCVSVHVHFPYHGQNPAVFGRVASWQVARCHRGLSPARIVSGGQNPLADSVQPDVIC